MNNQVRWFVALNVVGALLSTAHAAPPVNDDWAQRTVISALPFSATVANVAEATLADTDPRPFCRVGASSQGVRTVWYAITPSSEVYLTISASGYDAMLGVYSGAPGNFQQVFGGCNDDGLPSFAARIVGLKLAPGIEYSINVAQFSAVTTPGALTFQVSAPAPYVVTQFADRAGVNCLPGNCSLREAVSAATTAPAAILLSNGVYTLTLAGASENANALGDLDARGALAIYGTGSSVISALGLNDRALELDPLVTDGFTYILRGLSVVDGNVIGDGGAISAGTNTNDYLALADAKLLRNRATLNGGALRFGGNVEMSRSSIELNEANSSGGGVSFNGGANTRAQITESTVAENLSRSSVAGGGGGIFSSAGSTLVVTSTLSANRANFAGGGILVSLSTGGLQMRYSTLANNLADADGNDAAEGGGMRHEGGLSATLIGNLMSDNRTDSAGGALNDCSLSASAGALATASNFVRTVGNCEFNSSGDIVNLDPRLEALAFNGASTRTHLPAFGSAALDGLAAGCLPFDQRGIARPMDGNADQEPDCDFGAAESDVIFADTFTSAQ